YIWTIASGSLPSGLLMSGDGHITGTPLALGTSTFTVRVVDRDGIRGQQEFSIAVLTGSDLQDLQCYVPLVPAFDPATTHYSVNWVGSKFFCGATLATPDATMQVRLNGGAYETWDPDWNINGPAFPLNIGSNTLDLKVTAGDGVTSKTYTLAVTRTLSTKLVDFWVSNGQVTPTFNPETNAYRTSLPNDYTGLLAWAEDNSATLALRINGGTYESQGTDEMYRQIALAMGDNVIDVRVTAADASTRTYTLIATRTHGSICDGFNPGVEGGDRSGWRVSTMTVQADGKILAGGNFTTLGGQPRNHIGRLNSNGTLDTTFNPGISMAQGDQVFALAVQTDGKILVGGEFTTLAGQARAHLGRLNADGSLDSSFAPMIDGNVGALAIQPDGKILIGGSFQTLNGESRVGLGRLNANGLLDYTFANQTPYEDALALQADGKILLLGYATLYRLNTDGNLDTGFQTQYLSPYGWVRCLALQADGKILIGWLSDDQNYRIERLNSDGSKDSSFSAGASTESSSDYGVIALMPQADGKILVGGQFTTLSGQARQNIGRLNADGTVDPTFNPGISNGFVDCYVSSFALQPDGRIVVGGSFTMLGGQPRQNIARLMADDQGSPVIIFSNSSLPAGLTSVPYTGSLTASGGSLPY
ncbi:MAG: cadherin-like beta sandwich domain-containing protein, partial [Verrucomicrobiota bacterium]